MKLYKIIIFVCVMFSFFILLTQIELTATPKHKIELRAAIDIGSGATNLKIAEVDVTTQKIAKIIFEDQIPVTYQVHLENSTNSTFDQEVMTEGVHAIKQLSDESKLYHVDKIAAVATAAFRHAKNSQALVKQIQDATGIEVNVISQRQEGILAFNGVLATEEIDVNHSVVWDIGGGSLQFTMKKPDNNFVVYEGKIASIPFRNYIIHNIQGHDFSIVKTPNPISSTDASEAILYAETVGKSIDPIIQARLQEDDTSVYAVGSLFRYAIGKVVGDNNITLNNLSSTIAPIIGMTDESMGGQFSDTKLSNLLLVFGIMKNLHIKNVIIEPFNNTDGVLIDSNYYKTDKP